MPKLFDSSEEFNSLFESKVEGDTGVIIKSIHRLLRPFMLRRRKIDVERTLKKEEMYIYLGMSKMQRQLYKQILSKNIDVVNGAGDKL